MATYYISVCAHCGKKGNGGCSRVDGPPKSSPPSMLGKCPASPNDKHAPRWEVDYSRS